MSYSRLLLGIGLLCALQPAGLMAAVDQDDHVTFLQNITPPDELDGACTESSKKFCNDADRELFHSAITFLMEFDPENPEIPQEYRSLHERMITEDPRSMFHSVRDREVCLHWLGFLTHEHAKDRHAYEEQQRHVAEEASRERGASVSEGVFDLPGEVSGDDQNSEESRVEQLSESSGSDQSTEDAVSEESGESSDDRESSLIEIISPLRAQESEPDFSEESADNDLGQKNVESQGHGTSDDGAEQHSSDECSDDDLEPINFEDLSFTDEDVSEEVVAAHENDGASDDEGPTESASTSDGDDQELFVDGQSPMKNLSEEFTDEDLGEEAFLPYQSNGTSDDEAEHRDVSAEADPEHESEDDESDEQRATANSTSELILSPVPKMPEGAFVGRFYTDAAGKKYLVIGQRNVSHRATEDVCVDSEEFIHHVGNVLERYITRCGSNFGGILIADFESDDTFVPVALTNCDLLEQWVDEKKITHRLGDNVYSGQKWIMGVVPPTTPITFNNEGVIHHGAIVGVLQKGEFIPKEGIVRQQVLTIEMLAQAASTPLFSSSAAAETFSLVQASNIATGRSLSPALIAAGGTLATAAFWRDGLQKVRNTFLGATESKKDKKLKKELEEEKNARLRDSMKFVGKWALIGGATALGAGLLYWLMSPPSMDSMRAAAEGVVEALPVDRPSVTSLVSPFTPGEGTGAVTSLTSPFSSDGGTGAITSYTTLPWTRDSSGAGAVSSSLGSQSTSPSNGSLSPSGDQPSCPSDGGSDGALSDGSSYAPNAAPPVDDSLFTDEDLSSYPLERGNHVSLVEKPEGLQPGSYEWWKQWWKNNKNNLPPHRDYKPNYTYQR